MRRVLLLLDCIFYVLHVHSGYCYDFPFVPIVPFMLQALNNKKHDYLNFISAKLWFNPHERSVSVFFYLRDRVLRTHFLRLTEVQTLPTTAGRSSWALKGKYCCFVLIRALLTTLIHSTNINRTI